ncbi:MAG: hypothetical protein U1G08_08920 [Verrucomicrobiota bacterium]
MLSRTDAIVPATPAADHTGKEGFFVEPSGAAVAVINSAADLPLGVITEGRPQTGKDSIAICGGGAGIVKVKLSANPGAVVFGAYLVLDGATLGTAKLDPGAGARVRVARALEAGAADERIDAILLDPVALT